MEYSPLKDSRQICLRKGTRSKYESNKTPEDRIEVLTSKSKRPHSWLTTIGNEYNTNVCLLKVCLPIKRSVRFCSKHWMTGIFLTVSEEEKNWLPSPRLEGSTMWERDF